MLLAIGSDCGCSAVGFPTTGRDADPSSMDDNELLSGVSNKDDSSAAVVTGAGAGAGDPNNTEPSDANAVRPKMEGGVG